MKSNHCDPIMVNEYIEFYAFRNYSWDRFWNVMKLDFSLEYIRDKKQHIKKLYDFKLDIQQERNVKYSKVG